MCLWSPRGNENQRRPREGGDPLLVHNGFLPSWEYRDFLGSRNDRGGQRVRLPLHGATSSNNRRNKARMSMKTKDRGLECGSGTCGVTVLDRDGGRYRRRLGLQGGNCAVAFQNRRKKARMSMKTKDRLLECGSEPAAVEFRRKGGNWRPRTPRRLLVGGRLAVPKWPG